MDVPQRKLQTKHIVNLKHVFPLKLSFKLKYTQYTVLYSEIIVIHKLIIFSAVRVVSLLF